MRSSASDSPGPEAPRAEAGADRSGRAAEDEVYEEGREAAEEEEPLEEEEEVGERVDDAEGEEDEDEEEQGKLEWPAGVAQASDRDLAKLSHKEGVGSRSSLCRPAGEGFESQRWDSVLRVWPSCPPGAAAGIIGGSSPPES